MTGSWATRRKSRRAPTSANTLPPPTGFTKEEIEAKLKNIKLPPGFKIELWASGLPDARQMAWGDKGTLFVGSLSSAAATSMLSSTRAARGRSRPSSRALTVPTGVAYRDGSLYVTDIDKIYKYDNAEANLDNMPAAEGRL